MTQNNKYMQENIGGIKLQVGEVSSKELAQSLNEHYQVIEELHQSGYTYSKKENYFLKVCSRKDDIATGLNVGLFALIFLGMLGLGIAGHIEKGGPQTITNAFGIGTIILLLLTPFAYGSMYYSQERKEKLKKIEDKTNIFLDMLKDDAFKVSLAQSIEKEFNTLGQQLLSENVKMKESKSLEEMKSFLLEGDMNDMETFRKLLNNANEEQKELIYSLNSHKLNNAINRKSEKEFPDYILETIAQPQAQPQNLYLKRYL